MTRYAKNDSLYPKDPEKRGTLIQRLYFDMGVLYHRFSLYFYPQLYQRLPANMEDFHRMEEGLELLNKFLNRYTYIAGHTLTIADFAVVATISTYEAVGVKFDKYPNIHRWFEHCKVTIPSYKINEQGVMVYKKYIEAGLNALTEGKIINHLRAIPNIWMQNKEN